MEVPPLIPDLKQLLEDYLLHPEDLPIHSIEGTRQYVVRTPKPERLYELKLSNLKSSIQVERNPSTGQIIGVKEVFNQMTGLTNKNSMSLQRDLGPPDESVRGSSSNLPFWPGGLDFANVEKELKDDSLLDFSNLLTKHPKLSGGISFSASEKEKSVNREPVMKDIENVKIGDLLGDNDVSDIFDMEKPKDSKASGESGDKIQLDSAAESAVMSSLASEESKSEARVVTEVVKISDRTDKGKTMAKGTEWVVVLDVNQAVEDFSAKVPDPATTYPFELDTFQKQAVMHLEQRDCVFVAAHTSAGKTVVAEYAIALSLKNFTRSIYTSPIKALSNQKYRDLKAKFTDVGLLTGDIQINSKASCLIMTTEILQSMLYNGSDVIRDLEWVIFDEVHYINNADRGHVWEEVLIMLPSHVNIVLLSATVPNTVEFADWIGRIKKRKIYVISTTKRPVPLEHFIYTGTGGKTRDERFLILDHRKTFLQFGYKQALAAKEERESKFQQQYGAKQGQRNLGEKQEKHMWIGLIEHLNKRELLPVVAFTLSKKRCDSNATNLLSQDLTTKVEKGEIESFIRKCLDRLKGSDKLLPQVVHMRDLLRNGIGVHHSGILPMLKEVVEMLFAKGLVKILFATETFAMGVNMPARCVVFDSIRKHDGKALRDLLPSEYIQMAGRAGRRGLDSTGTVIILCKKDVPEVSDLNQMMLGKPSKLESQFKLTYSMMLNLLRVEALRVEDMMKRSFSESFELANQSKYTEILEKLTKQMETQQQVECVMCKDVSEYYALASDLINKREEIYGKIALNTSFLKTLQPGRLIIMSHSKHQNFICCLLKVEPRNKTKLTVFILSDPSVVSESSSELLKCMSAQEKINILNAPSAHELVHISTKNIVGVTNRVLKLNADKVMENIAKRKIPRFENDPPGASLNDLISEMQKIHDKKGEGLKIFSFRELGINEFDTVMETEVLEELRNRIKSQACVECPQFTEHFSQAFTYLKTREEIGFYKHKMSEESLQLHPEYQMRLNVLKKLGYIDESMTITLKGRIACEIGNHELMVTELLLENTFNEMPVEMIAALLSSLVFQQKLFGAEPDLTEEMETGIKLFKKIATKIGKVQKDCLLPEPVGDFVDQFKFGLVEVVHEWAHGLPFDKIMELTEVQEGIVVKCIQRLDETLRDVRNAAKLVGDPGLAEKMEKVSTAIKRDIVFAASLYTV